MESRTIELKPFIIRFPLPENDPAFTSCCKFLIVILIECYIKLVIFHSLIKKSANNATLFPAPFPETYRLKIFFWLFSRKCDNISTIWRNIKCLGAMRVRIKNCLLGHTIFGFPNNQHWVWASVSCNNNVLAPAISCAGNVITLLYIYIYNFTCPYKSLCWLLA